MVSLKTFERNGIFLTVPKLGYWFMINKGVQSGTNGFYKWSIFLDHLRCFQLVYNTVGNIQSNVLITPTYPTFLPKLAIRIETELKCHTQGVPSPHIVSKMRLKLIQVWDYEAAVIVRTHPACQRYKTIDHNLFDIWTKIKLTACHTTSAFINIFKMFTTEP